MILSRSGLAVESDMIFLSIKIHFTPQTISIANTSTLGTGVSVYIDNSGECYICIVESRIKILAS